MHKMNKFLIPFVFLIILSSLVLAKTYTVEYTSLRDSIYSNETAHYLLKIENLKNTSEKYNLFTMSAYWDVSPTLIEVDAQSSVDVKVELNQLEDLLIGPQLVPVSIISASSEELIEKNLYVYIKSDNEIPKTYNPSIAVQVKADNSIDPLELYTIDVNLRNRNALNISNLDVIISSELFSKTYKTTLGPLEEKTNQVIFEINPLQEPKEYDLNIRIMLGNQTITEVNKAVMVKEYSDISIDDKTVSGFLSKTRTIELENNGNYQVKKLVKVEIGFFERIFTSTSARPVMVKESGKKYMTWNVPLNPKEPYTLTVSQDYKSLFIIFVVLICVIIAYFILRSPVLIYKKAKIVSESEDGISEIKVKIHVKNRSGRIVKGLKILDRYPKMVELEDESSIGSIKPSKMISADKKYNVLVWNLDILEPYEERLMSYKVKSKLKIVGNIHLPSSKAKFNTPSGDRVQFSNNVKLLHKSSESIEDLK